MLSLQKLSGFSEPFCLLTDKVCIYIKHYSLVRCTRLEQNTLQKHERKKGE